MAKPSKKAPRTLAKLPIFGVTDLYSRNVFNEFFFQSYKGESEDRLRYFSEELFEEVLKPAIYAGTPELIAQSKKIGQRQIVITGALDFTIEKLMDYLGIDDYVANRLEFVNGYATGRILPPVMASATKAKWMREYAERENINLSESYRLFRQHLGSADALDCRSSGGRQSRFSLETNGFAARLGDFEFEVKRLSGKAAEC